MSSVLLHPGNIYKNGAFAGSGPWSDNVDSTYITLTAGPSISDAAHGWMPPLVSGGRVAVAIVLHLRYSATTTQAELGFHVAPSIVFDNPGGTGSVPFTDLPFMGVDVIADGAIHDLTYTAADSDYGWFGIPIGLVQQRLEGTAPTEPGLRAVRHVAEVPDTGTRTLRVIETWIEVVFRDVAAPLRLYPRADGRGIGAGRRWPPDRVTR